MSSQYLTSSNTVTPKASSINSAFLSPPETPTNEKDMPFKPTDSDNISLSMRKKSKDAVHGRRSKHWIASHSDLTDISKQADHSARHLSRPRSLPSLLSTPRLRQYPADKGQSLKTKSPTRSTSRRWTLPSKSMSTCGTTTLQPIVKQSSLGESRESPAMITLRRATNAPIRARRRTSITFFPEPTFNRPHSKLFAFLASTLSGNDSKDRCSDEFTSANFRTARSKTVVDDDPRLLVSVAAPPVWTEVIMEPNVTPPEAATDGQCSRRCSTRYVSDASTYEIIWDENDSNSNPSESSRASIDHFSSQRRPSRAAAKLAAQWLKSAEQSRRQSTISNTGSGVSSNLLSMRLPDHFSFQEVVDASLTKLVNQAALQNLPRSRAGKQKGLLQSLPVVDCGEPLHQTMPVEPAPGCECEVGVFPPPREQHSSCVKQSDGHLQKQPGRSDRRPSKIVRMEEKPRERLGSLVGTSSRVRRRSVRWSVGNKHWKAGRPDQDGQHLPDPTKTVKRVEESEVPLLDCLRWEEVNPY